MKRGQLVAGEVTIAEDDQSHCSWAAGTHYRLQSNMALFKQEQKQGDASSMLYGGKQSRKHTKVYPVDDISHQSHRVNPFRTQTGRNRD